jgi:hypothetical protein
LALSKLIELGLVSQTFSNKKKLFRVEGPENLKKLTQRMRRKAAEAETIVEQLIPELANASTTTTEEPAIVFYHGMNGVKNVLLDVAASPQSWYLFGSSTEMIKQLAPEDLNEILYEGVKFREMAGSPKIYFITDSGMVNLKMFAKPQPHLREVKVLPNTIKSGSALIISEDKIVILNYASPFAAVIKSKEVTEVVKIMYKLIWEGLKQPIR